jgi:hypothetical protein
MRLSRDLGRFYENYDRYLPMEMDRHTFDLRSQDGKSLYWSKVEGMGVNASGVSL